MINRAKSIQQCCKCGGAGTSGSASEVATRWSQVAKIASMVL